MAASSGDDIPAQLAALLGHPIKRFRITDETPPRISVSDARHRHYVQTCAERSKRRFIRSREAPRSVSKTEPLPFSWPRSAKHTRDVRY